MFINDYPRSFDIISGDSTKVKYNYNEILIQGSNNVDIVLVKSFYMNKDDTLDLRFKALTKGDNYSCIIKLNNNTVNTISIEKGIKREYSYKKIISENCSVEIFFKCIKNCDYSCSIKDIIIKGDKINTFQEIAHGRLYANNSTGSFSIGLGYYDDYNVEKVTQTVETDGSQVLNVYLKSNIKSINPFFNIRFLNKQGEKLYTLF